MTTTDAERWKAASEESLRFFGEMSASVSHEIRNKLAVINEKAGLLNDLALAVKSGRAIDPDRLELQAGKIAAQVKQANQIVRTLNRLAHSVDQTTARVDLAELIGLVAELSGRKAAMADVALEARVAAGAVNVVTIPFLLEGLISACIDIAMARVDDSRTLTITAEAMDGGAVIRFRGLAGTADPSASSGVVDFGARAILSILDGRLASGGRAGELVLSICNFEQRDSEGQP